MCQFGFLPSFAPTHAVYVCISQSFYIHIYFSLSLSLSISLPLSGRAAQRRHPGLAPGKHLTEGFHRRLQAGAGGSRSAVSSANLNKQLWMDVQVDVVQQNIHRDMQKRLHQYRRMLYIHVHTHILCMYVCMYSHVCKSIYYPPITYPSICHTCRCICTLEAELIFQSLCKTSPGTGGARPRQNFVKASGFATFMICSYKRLRSAAGPTAL